MEAELVSFRRNVSFADMLASSYTGRVWCILTYEMFVVLMLLYGCSNDRVITNFVNVFVIAGIFIIPKQR